MSGEDEEYGRILNAVMSSKLVRQALVQREIEDEIKFYGHRLRLVDFEAEVVDGFFEESIEEIVKVEEVWRWLQERLKDEIECILGDKEEFIENCAYSRWELEERVGDYLAELSKKLVRVLRKRHREKWRTKTLEDAEKFLKGDEGFFVVLLDKEGKVLEEPYPIIRRTDVGVKVEVSNYIHPRTGKSTGFKQVVAHFQPPIQKEKYTVKSMFITKTEEPPIVRLLKKTRKSP